MWNTGWVKIDSTFSYAHQKWSAAVSRNGSRQPKNLITADQIMLSTVCWADNDSSPYLISSMFLFVFLTVICVHDYSLYGAIGVARRGPKIFQHI